MTDELEVAKADLIASAMAATADDPESEWTEWSPAVQKTLAFYWRERANKADEEILTLRAEAAQMRGALEEIVNPLQVAKARIEAKGKRLSDMAYEVVNNKHYLQQIARDALALAPPKGPAT